MGHIIAPDGHERNKKNVSPWQIVQYAIDSDRKKGGCKELFQKLQTPRGRMKEEVIGEIARLMGPDLKTASVEQIREQFQTVAAVLRTISDTEFMTEENLYTVIGDILHPKAEPASAHKSDAA